MSTDVVKLQVEIALEPKTLIVLTKMYSRLSLKEKAPRRKTITENSSRGAKTATKGRGALLTCGDVEENPGPNNTKKSQPKTNMNVTAQNVNVTRKRVRNRKKKTELNPVGPVPIPETLSEGAMTVQPKTAGTPLQDWRAKKVDLCENSRGWYYKYCDPAGSVESGRAVGECGKIPDGLVKFSVDAEIREVFNDSVPGTTSGEIPIDSKALWSYHLISLPMFRTAYIAVANTQDAEISDQVAWDLCAWLNNLPDWRAIVDAEDWVQFSSSDTWFAKIRALRPTYDLGDNSDIRTVSSWRMTYKSITSETNVPTLLNQGFWLGGHYAQDSVNSERTPSSNAATTLTDVTEVTTLVVSSGWNGIHIQFQWVGLRKGGSTNSTVNPVWVNNSDGSYFAWRHGGNVPPAGLVEYQLPAGVTIAWQTTPTISGGRIRIFQRTTRQFVVQLETAANTFTTVVDELQTGENKFYAFFKTTDTLVTPPTNVGSQSGGSYLVELPPLTTDQIAANNPKMEQFLVKDTDGSYIVHSKMRNPVFSLTPAKNFGSFIADYPGYDSSNNVDGELGIRDSFDSNFSSAIVVFRGISHASTIVNKVYQGWEGVTASHTPFGQFGHSGLEKNDAILMLADDLASVRLTGVYPATDNFAASVSLLASKLLSSALNSQITQNAIAGLGSQATAAVQTGVAKLPSMIGSLLGRVGERLRERRLRRKQR